MIDRYINFAKIFCREYTLETEFMSYSKISIASKTHNGSEKIVWPENTLM